MNRELFAIMIRPRVQNAPGNIGKANTSGYPHGKAAQRSTKNQVEWLHLQPEWSRTKCGSSRTIRFFWKAWGIL